MENRKPLLNELDIFITSVEEYRTALREEDTQKLRSLLRDGKLLKEKIDRK
jgi:prephenate dehydrogenase